MRKINSQSVLNIEADVGNIDDALASLRSSIARSERRDDIKPEGITAEDARSAERLRTIRLHLTNAIKRVDAILAQ